MTAEIRRRCGSADEARRLARAVTADSPAYVTVAAEGTELRIHVDPAAPASLRATLDDLLACLQAAERTASAGVAERSRPRGPG